MGGTAGVGTLPVEELGGVVETTTGNWGFSDTQHWTRGKGFGIAVSDDEI